jgi:copper chaperone NosL
MQTQAKSETQNISGLSKVLLFLAAVMLVISIFTPIWVIYLDAPQYPEGLGLLIYSNKLGGNVDIINGLNHYIGMKTLHAEDFIEFTVLPYIIAFFALASLVVMFVGKKKLTYILLSAFILFGIIAMVDFWRWEYNYGHHLDPNAAIIVPGMAYQPPLIGFKQLLNFGAFSIPTTGGWLFIGSGVMMLIVFLLESKILLKFKKKNKVLSGAAVFFIVFLSACANHKPEPIQLNTDNCDYCKMTISNIRFATELLTEKGRVYKFDDMACLLNYRKENSNPKGSCYISDFIAPNALLKADSLFYISGENVSSPMGGNIAAFNNSDSAAVYLGKFAAVATNWQSLNQ